MAIPPMTAFASLSVMIVVFAPLLMIAAQRDGDRRVFVGRSARGSAGREDRGRVDDHRGGVGVDAEGGRAAGGVSRGRSARPPFVPVVASHAWYVMLAVWFPTTLPAGVKRSCAYWPRAARIGGDGRDGQEGRAVDRVFPCAGPAHAHQRDASQDGGARHR